MAVYFIRAGNYVKIGSTTGNIQKRIREMQVANYEQLELMRVVSGGVSKERWIHEKFSSCRKRGEWFRLTSKLKNFIFSEDVETMPAKKVSCVLCGKLFMAQSEKRIYCGGACKQVAYRARIGDTRK